MPERPDPKGRKLSVAAIRACVGSVGDPYFYPAGVQSPIGMFYDYANEKCQVAADLAFIETETPEHFVLRGLGTPCIVFDQRLVTRSFEFSSVVTRWDMTQDFGKSLIDQLLHEKLCECFLQLRDPVSALACLNASIGGVNLHSATVVDADLIDIDEMYISLWLLFLAHEYGHLVAGQLEHSLNDFVSSDNISSLFTQALELSKAHTPIHAWSARKERLAARYDEAQLRTESISDIAAAILLFGFSNRLLSKVDRKSLARAMALFYCIMITNFNAKSLAKMVRDNSLMVAGPGGELDYIGQSFRVRYSIMANAVARLVSAETKGWELSSEAPADREILMHWDAVSNFFSANVTLPLSKIAAELSLPPAAIRREQLANEALFRLERAAIAQDAKLRIRHMMTSIKLSGILRTTQRLGLKSPMLDRLRSALQSGSDG